MSVQCSSPEPAALQPQFPEVRGQGEQGGEGGATVSAQRVVAQEELPQGDPRLEVG